MAVFVLNLAMMIGGLGYALLKAWRAGTLVNPLVVMWGMPVILLGLPGLSATEQLQGDVGFNLVVTAALLGTMAATWVANNIRAFRTPDNVFARQPAARLPDKGWLMVGAALYLVFIAGTIGAAVVSAGGVIAALSVARVQAYLEGGILVGRSVELLFILPQILYYMYVGYLLEKKRYFAAFCGAFVITIFYVFTANTRLPMVFPLFALLTAYVASLRAEVVRRVAPIVIVIALFALLLFGVIGNVIRHGEVAQMAEAVDLLLENSTAQATSDFGYYGWLYDLYDGLQQEKVELDAGKAWFVLGPASIVPRIAWSSKPITSTSNRLTEDIYGITVGDGSPITTFTAYGEGYFQFWYPGAFLAPVLFLALYLFILRQVREFRYTGFWTGMILLHMCTQLRGEMPVPDVITWTLCLLILRLISRPTHEIPAVQPA